MSAPEKNRRLEQEAIAAKALVEAVAAFEDEELTADTVEGESELFEIVDKMLAAEAFATATAKGAEEMAAAMKQRADAAKERSKRIRAAIEAALLTAGLEGIRFTRPAGTMTLKRNPEQLEVEEESEIPTQFFKRQQPRLDRAGLKKALKDGPDPIPGARLRDGGFSLQIRRK